jgi:AAA ATPase domain
VRIESFRAVNYKSFADSGEIHLEPGFNVIVGRNNVGKTALAEAMSLRFPSKPHRSLNTIPTPGTPIDQNSRAAVAIVLEANELVDLLIRDMPTFHVPTDTEQQMTAGQAMLSTALSEGATVNATFLDGGHHSAQLSTYVGPTPPDVYLRLTTDRSGSASASGPIQGVPSDYPHLPADLAVRFHERLYSFQRHKVRHRREPYQHQPRPHA